MADVIPPAPQQAVSKSVYAAAIADLNLVKADAANAWAQLAALEATIKTFYSAHHVILAFCVGALFGLALSLVL